MAPRPTDSKDLLPWHLRELVALEARLEPDHVARKRIATRIEECRDAIKADQGKA